MTQRKYTSLLLVFIGILLWAVTSSAQVMSVRNLPKYDYKKYHFGFILGLNQMDFVVNPINDFRNVDSIYGVETEGEMGFNIGIVSNLRLAEYWDFRFIPTLSFGDRNVIFRVRKYSPLFGDTAILEEVKRVESTYLDFPFYFKYKSKRLNNMRAYVIGGFKYSIDLASQAKKKEREDEYLIKLIANDMLMETGVGFDFYLQYFKFGIELKMSYGIFDLLKRENNVYSESIDQLSSKIFQLSFTFE